MSEVFDVMMEMLHERFRQACKWGEQSHPDGTGDSYDELCALAQSRCGFKAKNGTLTWKDILLEEVYEALSESDPARLRAELLQAGAVCAAWVEDIDRRARCG